MADAIPRLLLKAEDKNLWSVILHHADGKTTTLPCATPAEHLIAASEIDYRPYRREIQTLREQHPLFEARFQVSLEDFEDFVAEALLLPSMLQEIDPVWYFVLEQLLDHSLRQEDDGSASFLLRAANQLLQILEEPVRTQVYLRNVLEIALYFQQDKQRIARCDYCWLYFIPKTRKETHYCDRKTDGFPCKQRGSRFKRNLDAEQDEALLACKRLRDRMYARMLRYTIALPENRQDLICVDYMEYDAWSENARLARMEYLDGKLTGEEFLRKIDTMHDLEDYTVDEVQAPPANTPWQRMVAGDMGFDPETHYPEAVMQLDLGTDDPQWQTCSADDLRRRDQEGHQSLREKYATK